jgi:beta-galactosidase/beta-glucuronidase
MVSARHETPPDAVAGLCPDCHNFVGKGWYKRQVEIPQSWADCRAFLIITGVSRYAKVWIDDHFLGEHIGYLSVQEYDVTQYAGPGKTVTITIQVDSKQRWEVDAMFGALSLAD